MIIGKESSKLCNHVPNLTLSPKFGHKYYDQHFTNSSCAECKNQLNKLFPTYYQAWREIQTSLFTTNLKLELWAIVYFQLKPYHFRNSTRFPIFTHVTNSNLGHILEHKPTFETIDNRWNIQKFSTKCTSMIYKIAWVPENIIIF